jgi:hypothetical protein
MANFMFGKLIGPQMTTARQSIQNLENTRSVTLKDIEEQLVQWWLTKEANKVKPQSTGTGSLGDVKGKTFKKSQDKTQHIPTGPKGSDSNPTLSTPSMANSAQSIPSNSMKSNKKKKHHQKGMPNQSTEIGESYTVEGQPDDDGLKQTEHIGGVAITLPSEENSAHIAASAFKSGSNNFYIPRRHEMLWDTGATSSMTPLKEHVEDIQEVSPIEISTMGGKVSSNLIGTFRFKGKLRLDNIHVVPKAPYSLLSLSKATTNGAIAIFTGDGAFLLPPHSRNDSILKTCNEHAILYGERKGNLWVTPMVKPQKEFNERFVKENQSTLQNRVGIIPKKKNDSVMSSSSSPSPLNSSMKNMISKEEKKGEIGKGNSNSPVKKHLFTPNTSSPVKANGRISANHYAIHGNENVEDSPESDSLISGSECSDCSDDE